MRAEPLPHPDAPPVSVRIDTLDVTVPQGTTVLRAAETAGITIPSLCAHRELSPFGGCRLCAVEIAGMRGAPLACSTVVTEGMDVTTDSPELRRTRQDVLRLILSQHPSSCLICGESDECARSQKSIHKAGVATGCRSCTNDEACELQDVARLLGVTEIGFPVTYRALEPEQDDPFYDRDYNLCILCGRCVRMCQEVRGTAVLAFKYRGRSTLIGPSFGDSHVEAGCEFCRACVDVCPTGALAERVSKWDGSPDVRKTSTCPFCFLGCRLELAEVDGRLSSASGAADAEINDGQLCVRGAFCLPETTHHHDRLRTPMLRRGEYSRVATWEEALDEVAERLRAADGRVDMLVSGDLSNEGLFAAKCFVRKGLGDAASIDSSARRTLPGGPALWSRLFSLPISLRALSEADAVIVAGLDSRFSFSVVGVLVRRALRRGGRLVTLDAREDNLALMADEWLRPKPGMEAQALAQVLGAVAGRPPQAEETRRTGLGVRRLKRAARTVGSARRLAIVVGPRVFDCPGADKLTGALEAIASRDGVTIVPLTYGANVRGALEMGVLSGPPADAAIPAVTDTCDLTPRVLYLVGETPFVERPGCEYVIAQDLYPPPFDVDAFLPAASFAEAAGTITNIEGRVQELVQTDRLTADRDHTPLADWRIFSELAGRLGETELEYADDAAVRDAIRAAIPGFPQDGDRAPRRVAPQTAAGRQETSSGEQVEGRGGFLLVQERPGFRHRGIDMASVVGGLGELRLEEGLGMCPHDMERLGVAADDPVTVAIAAEAAGGDVIEVRRPVRPDPACPRGAVYLTRDEALGRAPARPVKVRVSSATQQPERGCAGDEPDRGSVGPGRRAAGRRRASGRH